MEIVVSSVSPLFRVTLPASLHHIHLLTPFSKDNSNVLSRTGHVCISLPLAYDEASPIPQLSPVARECFG